MKKINWALLGSVVSAISGIVGTVLTPLYGTGLTTGIQNVLQAISGLLIAIGALHVTSVAATKAKAVNAARLAQRVKEGSLI